MIRLRGKGKQLSGWTAISWTLLIASCATEGPEEQSLPDGRPVADASPADAAPPDAQMVADAQPELDAAAPGCPRVPAPADRPRKVVVSHPYVAAATYGNTFEVLDLSADGTLERTQTTFKLGTVTDGRIAFTPDGEIGLVAQKDGTVGVFRFDGNGAVQVVSAAFATGAFASSLMVSPDGAHVYVLSTQWPEHGGGVYRLRIGCDGALSDEQKIVPAKLPYAMRHAGPQKVVLSATEALGSSAGEDVHLIDLASQAKRVASADAFDGKDAIVSSGELTADGRYFLIADQRLNGGRRLAAVELAGNSLRPAQTLVDIPDPGAIFMSPFGELALVLNTQADQITVLEYDPTSATPFKLREKLATTTPSQLPSAAVGIDRGKLRGRVLISENTALRQLQFDGAGQVEDLGTTSFGTGIPAIVGALGVQP